MTEFWNDIVAIKQAIVETEDNITRWTIRSRMNWSQAECKRMLDALYSESIDLCIRRDELDDELDLEW